MFTYEIFKLNLEWKPQMKTRWKWNYFVERGGQGKKSRAPPTQTCSNISFQHSQQHSSKTTSEPKRAEIRRPGVKYWINSSMYGGFSFLISKVESIPVLHGCCGGSDEMRHVKSTLKLQSNIQFVSTETWLEKERTRWQPGKSQDLVHLG